MLARHHRFHGHRSLLSVYRHGAVVRGQLLSLRYARNQQQAEYRLAVIVSRKVHKSAVQRNRVRRRIYELVRTGPAIVEPYDLVITVFSDQIVAMSPEELSRLVRNLFSRAHISNRQAQPVNRLDRGIVKDTRGSA